MRTRSSNGAPADGPVDEGLRQQRVGELQANAGEEEHGEQRKARPVRPQVGRDEVADGFVGHKALL